MFNVLNRLSVACVLVFALTTHAALSFADQPAANQSVPNQESISKDAKATQVAMNDADVVATKGEETSVADAGPVLLVPMVLAVLALVAVSRRKES